MEYMNECIMHIISIPQIQNTIRKIPSIVSFEKCDTDIFILFFANV